jgi:hypothetical protein
MVEAIPGLLTFAVFGLLWVASQDWFDLLPRRVARRVSGGAFVVLVGTCWLAPSAFQSGFHRFTDYLSSKIAAQLQDAFRRVVDMPTSTPPASPVSTPQTGTPKAP